MRKAIVLLSLFISLTWTADAYNLTPVKSKVEYVLICNSRSAYAYHRKECSGLARCTHGESRVTKAEAIKMGYRACKICYCRY